MRKLLYQFTLIALNSLLIFPQFFCACKTEETPKTALMRENTTYYSLPTLPKAKEENTAASEFWSVENEDVSLLNPTKKYLSFTFDDAPTINLPTLVEAFSDFNKNNPDCVASATVFYNGINLNEYTLPYIQSAYEAGLELGNHTYSHCDLRKLSKEELAVEIDLVDEFLQKIDGKPRHLLRAPYGAVSDDFRAIAQTPILDWSVDTLDWTHNSADEICEKVLNGLQSGAIVLFHDGSYHTVEAVQRLLPLLKEKGYQVVSVSKLSKIHTCPLRIGGLYTRARPKKS